MQIQQLHHFLAAVTYGSFSRAASHCNITQPAITRSIQRLEDTLGLQLLERTGRGVSPTEAGKVLRDYARQITRDTKLIRQRLADMSAQTLGEVRIGISANFVHDGLAVAIAEMLRKWPGLRLSICHDFCSVLIERLSAGEVDIIIALVPDDLDAQEFVIHEVFDVSGGVYVGPGHPLCRLPSVPLAELARYRWIALDAGTETARYLSRRFGPFDLRTPDVPVRTDSPALMKQLLRVSQLVGLAPARMFAQEAASGEIVKLVNELDPIRVRGSLVHRRSIEHSSPMNQFIQALYAALIASIPAEPG